MSSGQGLWTKLRNTDAELHKLAVKYQRSVRKLEKAKLDLQFLLDCKKEEVYPNFVRWKNITRMKRKTQKRYLQSLLKDATTEKKSTIRNLSTLTHDLKQQLRSRTTWMKFQLICFAVNRTLEYEKKRIVNRHNRKLQTLVSLKHSAEGLEENPNDTIVNLTGQLLSDEQMEVLKLGLRYGLATRPNHFEIMSVAEDVWDQVSKLDNFKEGRYVQDKVKNSLRSFT